jgi:membrane associated rhomboid family serine protease
MGGKSGRLSRGLRQLRDASATWMLLRILLVAQAIPFIWDLAVPGAGKMALAQQFLGLGKNSVLSGSFWQPFTYAFIHANWFHLLANATCILLLGPKLEHIIPRRTFWLLSLFSILAGGALFIPFSPAAEGDPPTLVGSSAVCFGFLILLTTLSPDSRFLPFSLSGRSIGIAIILANLALTLLNPDLPTGPMARWGKGLADSGLDELFQISHACHLGGSIVGFLYGRFLLRPRVTLDTLKRAREKRESAGKPQK